MKFWIYHTRYFSLHTIKIHAMSHDITNMHACMYACTYTRTYIGLQCIAERRRVMQSVAVFNYCSTGSRVELFLQHTATHCNTLQHKVYRLAREILPRNSQHLPAQPQARVICWVRACHLYLSAALSSATCVAVYCSALQCGAVSALARESQCFAEFAHALYAHHQLDLWNVQCSVLQYVAACCSMLRRIAAYCSVLQCVVVCCSVLQCVAVCCEM